MTIHYPPTPASALWALAHPRGDSLSAQLRDVGVEQLGRTHRVTQSDLHAQGFDPVLGAHDIARAMPRPGGPLDDQEPQRGGWSVPADVLAEQRKLAEAELIVLQFPLWWYSTPAILKGWFDRVLLDGFAYGDLDAETGLPRRYGEGGLSGRRALIVVTAGDDAATLGPRGISGDLEGLLFPLTHGTLWYTGIEAHALHVIHDADGLDAAGVERESERLRVRLAGLDREEPRRYRALRDGDYAGTRTLRGDLAPGRSDLGIHLVEPAR